MYLGIDLGTSGVKLLLLAQDHRLVAETSVALSVSHPHPLGSEQDPAQWWQALSSGMQVLHASHPQAMRQVGALGLSGQMHGAVLIDAQGQVLRPAMLWNDGRSMTQCVQMTRDCPELGTLSGNLAMPGFTAPKLAWLRTHEPDVFARIDKVLLPKDYLRLRLTGICGTDYSDASGTLWLDVGARAWSPRLLALSGLHQHHMPELFYGDAVSGLLQADVAAPWGLTPGLPVAGGAGDNAASAVGMGRVTPGSGFVSLGTSGVIYVNTANFKPDPARAVHSFCHAFSQGWHQMSVMLSAASAVSWASKALRYPGEAALLAAAGSLSMQARARAPVFLPYLSGERSPHNNPLAQALWFGITQAHTDADLAYAVVEGVGFGLCDGYQTLSGDSDSPVRELSLVGGGARDTFWSQLLSTQLDLPLVTHTGAHAGAALGAARLAWLASGGTRADVLRVPRVAHRFEPQQALRDMVAQRHGRYRDLYARLQPLFDNR
jgi:xylulokinase